MLSRNRRVWMIPFVATGACAVTDLDSPDLGVATSSLTICEGWGCGHNTGTVTVDRLMVEGMGTPFLLGVAGSVTGLKIVDGSWTEGPISVDCSIVDPWEAKIVTRDASYQPTTVSDYIDARVA